MEQDLIQEVRSSDANSLTMTHTVISATDASYNALYGMSRAAAHQVSPTLLAATTTANGYIDNASDVVQVFLLAGTEFVFRPYNRTAMETASVLEFGINWILDRMEDTVSVFKEHQLVKRMLTYVPEGTPPATPVTPTGYTEDGTATIDGVRFARFKNATSDGRLWYYAWSLYTQYAYVPEWSVPIHNGGLDEPPPDFSTYFLQEGSLGKLTWYYDKNWNPPMSYNGNQGLGDANPDKNWFVWHSGSQNRYYWVYVGLDHGDDGQDGTTYKYIRTSSGWGGDLGIPMKTTFLFSLLGLGIGGSGGLPFAKRTTL